MGAIRQFWAWLEPLDRRRALGGAIALALLAGALLGGIFGGKDAEANADTLAQSNGPPNALSVLASRSPGARLGGALYQTKPRLAAAVRRPPARRAFLPSERVLSAVRTRPALFAAPSGGQEPAFGLQDLPVEFITVPSLTPPGSGLAFDIPEFAFGEAPLVSNTPGLPGTTPQEPGSAIPGTPGPAVPEPATWLMMIVGLGVVGQALRRSGAFAPNVIGRA